MGSSSSSLLSIAGSQKFPSRDSKMVQVTKVKPTTPEETFTFRAKLLAMRSFLRNDSSHELVAGFSQKSPGNTKNPLVRCVELLEQVKFANDIDKARSLISDLLKEFQITVDTPLTVLAVNLITLKHEPIHKYKLSELKRFVAEIQDNLLSHVLDELDEIIAEEHISATKNARSTAKNQYIIPKKLNKTFCESADTHDTYNMTAENGRSFDEIEHPLKLLLPQPVSGKISLY